VPDVIPSVELHSILRFSAAAVSAADAPPQASGLSPLLLFGVIVARAGLLAMVLIMCFASRDE
jgi:hypothetical protein